MQVHLVTVEISVVRRCDGQIQAESRVGHHTDSVTRIARLFVQRRLTVEDDEIAVDQMALYLPAVFQLNRAGTPVEWRRSMRVPSERITYLAPGCCVRSVLHELGELANVVRRDSLRIGQGSSDASGHADLVQRDVGITR